MVEAKLAAARADLADRNGVLVAFSDGVDSSVVAALDPEFARAAREHIGDLGFEHVTLDLGGYRTGSVSPEETRGAPESQ